MLTKQEAQSQVHEHLSAFPNVLPEGDAFVIVDDATIECQWGWVFFYTSKLWRETKDIRYAIAGNGPIIIDKLTGKLSVISTANSIELSIQNYVRTGNPNG